MSKWPKTYVLHGDATVHVFLTGLMAFSYNRQRGCEIGFYESGKHNLSIVVSENGQPKNIDIPNGLKEISLAIDPSNPTVDFFHAPKFSRFGGNRYDFRWLLDLEENDGGFGSQLLKREKYFKKKMFVPQGTFFTYLPSASTFTSPDGPSEQLGHVARVIGTNISIAEKQELVLSFDGKPEFIFRPTLGTVYNLCVRNDCAENHKPCDDTDFDLVFGLMADTSQRFDVVLDQDNSRYAPSDPIPHFSEQERIAEEMFASDRAPCMGAAFGESDGFP